MRDPCSYCGDPVAEIDHIVAGGGNAWTNLTGACRRCNRRKGDVPLLFTLLGFGSLTFRAWPEGPRFPQRQAASPAKQREYLIQVLRAAQRAYESALLVPAMRVTAARPREITIRFAHQRGMSDEEIAGAMDVSFQLIGRITGRKGA